MSKLRVAQTTPVSFSPQTPSCFGGKHKRLLTSQFGVLQNFIYCWISLSTYLGDFK